MPLPPASAGRLYLCGKHFIGPDPDAALAGVGASVAVCLTERHEVAGRYPDYAEWLDTHAGGRALWWPIADLHAPSTDEFTLLIDAVRARIDRGEGVVVHCGAGMGRAGTVAAAVLVSLGVGMRDALAQVGTARPGAGPQSFVQDELLAAFAERQ